MILHRHQLTTAHLSTLEQAYRDGLSQREAAKLVACSTNTTWIWFGRFKRAGLSRARTPRPGRKPGANPSRGRKYPHISGLPEYTGPDWIGKACG